MKQKKALGQFKKHFSNALAKAEGEKNEKGIARAKLRLKSLDSVEKVMKDY